MTEENPYAVGPPADYDPPPIDDLRDPEFRTRTHQRGRQLVLQVLADCGIRKQGDKWLPRAEESSSPDPGS